MDASGLVPDEGVVAKIVVISAEGAISEHDYDSTPAKNSLVQIMGGQVSIVGMYASQSIIILRLQNPGEASENALTLPAPFNTEKIKGPIALVKMNFETTDAEDYSKSEFEALQKMDAGELAKLEEEAHAKRAAVAEAELAEADKEEEVEGEE